MKPPRLLIVDDEEQIRVLLSEFLTGCGYRCKTASNGQKALERIQKKTFALLITDVRMPKMSGIELLTQLRAAGNELPAIVMTAHPDDATLKPIYAMGVDGVVGKPFLLREMEHLVRGAIAASMPITESDSGTAPQSC